MAHIDSNSNNEIVHVRLHPGPFTNFGVILMRVLSRQKLSELDHYRHYIARTRCRRMHVTTPNQ